MNNRFIKILLGAAALFASAASCQKQEDFSRCKAPVINLMMEELHPDLNRVDNTPVVCVIFSEAGLSSVRMYITDNYEETLHTEITDFHDVHQYSLNEDLSWTETMSKVRVAATDKAGKNVEVEMKVIVTPILPAPVIVFEKERIVIDEKKEDPSSVQTKFEVTSSSKLSGVVAKLFRAEGTVELPLTPSFEEGVPTYAFDQVIDYANGDRALQVTATDVNGKMKIETLPVNYIPAPAPEFTPTGTTSADPIFVRSTESRSFTFNVVSETGISAIQAFSVKKNAQGERQDVLLDTQYYQPDSNFDVDYAYSASSFDVGSFAVKFVAIDRLNHSSSFEIPAIVDMRMGSNIILGSQYNAKNPLIVEGYPGQEAYCFFSVRDFKTYSLFYFWDEANRRNIDFFYFSWNASGSSDNGSRLMRSNEDRQGQDSEGYLKYVDPEDATKNIPELGTGGVWGSRNATLLKKLTTAYTFNFDNATLEDLTSPQLATYLSQSKTNADWVGLKAGDCVVFKTGSLSTCPNCVGILRVESVIGSRTDFGKSPVYFEISIKAQIVD